MKKYMIFAVTALLLAACSDWTEPEALNMMKYKNTEIAYPESYYEALREWKKTEHSRSFGWFSSWGDGGTSTANMLSGLPDSMDLVSIWGVWHSLTEAKKADLRYVQEKKGTKVMLCTFIQHVGKGFTPAEYDVDEATREEFWGWQDGNDDKIKASLAKYAQAMVDSLYKYNYDGIDIDFEPSVDAYTGKLDENSTYVTWFIEILGKYLGPKSGSGKLLCIDGQIPQVPRAVAAYFDYLIVQAYTVSGGSPSPTATGTETNMDSRVTSAISSLSSEDGLNAEQITNRYIVTENMESALDGRNGGFFWRFRNGETADKTVIPSLVGMAMWEPANGFRKGGFGGYRFDCENINTPSYKWMRRAIQAQNPATN